MIVVASIGSAFAQSGNDARAVVLVSQAGSIVTAPPPMITDYWMSATRQSGGVIVFDGYAPDAQTRKRLSEVENADTNFLKLGRGAPANYQTAVDFGLAILDKLSEGRFALRDGTISLSGLALSSAAFSDIAQLITGDTPPGLQLARNDIRPPVVTPYLLSVTKSADGKLALAGNLPTVLARDSLAAGEGKPSVTAVTYASGEPNDLVVSATTALGLMKSLQSGTARFDGSDWTVSGVAATSADKATLETAFATRRLSAAGWTLDVEVAPAQVAAAPTPAPGGKTKPPVTNPDAPAAPAISKPTPPAVTEQPAEPTPPVPEPGTHTTSTPVTTPSQTPPPPPAEPVVAEPETPPVDPAYAFSATREAGGAVTMSGKLPADPALRFFGVITGAPTTGVTIADGAPEDFVLDAEAGIRALMELDTGALRFEGGRWTLTGKAPTNAVRTTLLATIAALPAGADWTLDITAPPQLDACQADVAAFSARNAILFQSGAAVLAPQSSAALDELAGYLASCPAADVDVEGHTDADGDDQLNLALSVARAEAVIDALVARNIAPARLYAVGYGESQPIADNATTAGKQLNRRIVIKVLEHHVD